MWKKKGTNRYAVCRRLRRGTKPNFANKKALLAGGLFIRFP
jgi:hypothetical protein